MTIYSSLQYGRVYYRQQKDHNGLEGAELQQIGHRDQSEFPVRSELTALYAVHARGAH